MWKRIIALRSITPIDHQPIYPKLGRWSISHDYSVINHKIDQANVDHSGHTEQYADLDLDLDPIKEKDLLPYCL
jgi:hypothetical protein